jgi:hypothetical protein
LADSVPILGLGAAVAWVSLVTLEFYERIYHVSGFWFLWKMLWFDEQILRVSKSKPKIF